MLNGSIIGIRHLGGLSPVILGVVCAGLLLGAPGDARAAAITVNLTSTPAPHVIRPDADYARVMAQVLMDGKPLSAGHLQVQIAAPARPAILSTDFPIVEGTRLMSLASDLHEGTYDFSYLFPIRGTYAVDLTVSPVPGGPTFPVTTLHQTLQLRENPAEVRNVWFLVLGLFILGGIFGALFARSAAARDVLPSLAALVLSMLLLRVLMPAGATVAAAPAPHVVQGEADWALEIRPTPAQATVGQMVRFDVALRKDGHIFPETTQVAIRFHHVEDDKTMFQTTTRAHHGQSAQSFQFFDGAPHTVTVTAQPLDREGVAPLQAVFEMDVEGLQPPMAVKIRTLVLLLGVLAVGMAAGFFLAGRREERVGV